MRRGLFACLAGFALSLSCGTRQQQADGAVANADADAGANEDAGLLDEPAMRGEDFLLYALYGEAKGQTITLSFEVPADAHAFVITVAAHTPRTLLLTSLEGPSGRVLFTTRKGQSNPLSPPSTRNLAPEFPLSILVPSKTLGLSGGRVSARFYAGSLRGPNPDESLDADVVFQKHGAASTLQARVWVPYGEGRGPIGLREDETFRQGLAVMRDIFMSAGISVLDPVFSTLMPPALSSTQVADATAIAAWLEQLPASDEPGLDFLLVNALASPEGVTLVGKTVGIPGPPIHPSLPRRGAVVLSRGALPADGERVGEILAHEAAHYLGLAHTTEMDGSHDALADTPQCPLENASFLASSGETVSSAEDCIDFDGQNLMFWMPARTLGPQRVLSPSQMDVINDHPAVQ